MTLLSFSLSTEFAPASRASMEELQSQTHYFKSLPLMGSLLSAVPQDVLVLNQHRQIVFANDAFLTLLGLADLQPVIGLRLGEAIKCEHAFDNGGGCGTSEFCRTCGAVKSILAAQEGEKNRKECRLTILNEQKEMSSLDLMVSSTPHEFDGKQFTIFTISDISGEKRRRFLERLFFHDITNTAGAINGLAELLNGVQSLEEIKKFKIDNMLSISTKRLLDEIQAQRQLMAAENGDLSIQSEHFYTNDLLTNLLNIYENHPVAENRRVRLSERSDNVLLLSDQTILGRVIGNMIKNALEASDSEETITIGCQGLFDNVRFWVHNPQHISKRIQLQIFQRSFSTKGDGRGLGTYSMKMFAENYLQGRVSFESTPEDGTTFMGMFPLELCESNNKEKKS